MSKLLVFTLLAAVLHGGAPAQQRVDSDSKTLEETARLVEVEAEVLALRKTINSGEVGDGWQMLRLHQHIYERISAVSLQVDATIAQIDNEIARVHEVRGYLADRRDHAVTRSNLLGIIVGGGLGATSSGLQLSSTLTRPAAAVGIGAGALSTGFGIVGIRAQRGESSRFTFNSNMLAEIFDRAALPDSHYPAAITIFLNLIPATGAGDLSRKQQLIQTWVEVKRIESARDSKKIEHLTSQPSESLLLSLDDFEDRAAMLEDLRAKISFLKRDLGVLLASLPQIPERRDAAAR